MTTLLRARGPTLIAIAAWLALGLLDFRTGFVAYSSFRLLVLGALVILLFPLRVPPALQQPFVRPATSRLVGVLILLGLTFAGFAIFLGRAMRGANMGDTWLFKDVVDYSSTTCVLCDHTGVFTSLKAHTNWFLLLFVPLRAIAGWIFLAAWLQSACIIIWCRIGGWALGGSALTGWVVTGALFLATYTQHATFYDTRFAALALMVFALGIVLNRRAALFGGILGVCLTRETAALNIFMAGVAQVVRRRAVKFYALMALGGLLWYVASIAFMHTLGGPLAIRFDPCLFSTRILTDVTCASTAAATDWPLKLAYTLRVLLFAPSLAAWPAYVSVLPDVVYTWLSRDDVLYNLSWHYYMQALGLLLIGASALRQPAGEVRYADRSLVRWVVAMSLWQFATTFQANLL